MATPGKNEPLPGTQEKEVHPTNIDPLRVIYAALAQGGTEVDQPDTVQSDIQTRSHDAEPGIPARVPTHEVDDRGPSARPRPPERGSAAKDGNTAPHSGQTMGQEAGLSERLLSVSLSSPKVEMSRESRRAALRLQGEGRQRRDGTWDEADAKPKAKRQVKNVLTRMDAAQHGPLSILYRAVNERLKVKVWVRSYKHVRGICTGYIAAFDTHWNLAMLDVDEVYKPAVPRLVPPKKPRIRRKKMVQGGVSSSEKAPPSEIPAVVTDSQRNAPRDSPNTGVDLPVTAQLDGTVKMSSSSSSDESGDSFLIDIQDQVDGPPYPQRGKTPVRASTSQGQEPDPGKVEVKREDSATSEDDRSDTTESELSQTEESGEGYSCDTEEDEEDDGGINADDGDDEESLQQLMDMLGSLKNELMELEKIEAAEQEEEEQSQKKDTKAKSSKEKHVRSQKLKSEEKRERFHDSPSSREESPEVERKSEDEKSRRHMREYSKSKLDTEDHPAADKGRRPSKKTDESSVLFSEDQLAVEVDLKLKLRRTREESGRGPRDGASRPLPSRVPEEGRHRTGRESHQEEERGRRENIPSRDTERHRKTRDEEAPKSREQHAKSSVHAVTKHSAAKEFRGGRLEQGEERGSVYVRDKTEKQKRPGEELKSRESDVLGSRSRRYGSQETEPRIQEKTSDMESTARSSSRRSSQSVKSRLGSRVTGDVRQTTATETLCEKYQSEKKSEKDKGYLQASTSAAGTRPRPRVDVKGDTMPSDYVKSSGVARTSYDVQTPASKGQADVRLLSHEPIRIDHTGLFRRHVNQLFIRGDNIVMVALIQ